MYPDQIPYQLLLRAAVACRKHCGSVFVDVSWKLGYFALKPYYVIRVTEIRFFFNVLTTPPQCKR